MRHDLCKCILQFYRALGIDILFDSMDSPEALCVDNTKNKEDSSCNNINPQHNNKINRNYTNSNINNRKISTNNDILNNTDIIDSNNINRNTYSRKGNTDNALNNANVIYSKNVYISNDVLKNAEIVRNNSINHINNNAVNNSLDKIIKKYDNNLPLKQLLIEISNIDCIIKHTARNTVVFDGDINSEVMIIGEAPGQEEDIQGKPFVGQSGMLLNNMLRAIGLSREKVIISNIVFWRPPFNRTPSTDEISLCLPYVQRLIEIIRPKVLLLLGAVSNHALLNTMAPMSRLRGSINSVSGIKAVSTYHPAYLLRSSTQKKYAFHDFLLLKHIINGDI